MSQEINDNLKLVVSPTLEVVKRKVAAIKKLEDETIDICENEEQLEQLVIESTDYELYTKQNIARFSEFLNKNFTTNADRKVQRSVEKASANFRLPKLEIVKFAGKPTKWQIFIDSYETATNSSSNLNNIEKLNYLRCYLEGDVLHTIPGLTLTNENYNKVLDLLKNRYGNPQLIISAHKNELLKSKKITSDKDLTGLRKFFDNIESHVRSLQGLGIESKSYGSLLAPIILERLPDQLKLIISRNLKSEIWDLHKILLLINEELRARESCILPSNSFNSISNDEKQGGKNNLSHFESPTSGSALYAN